LEIIGINLISEFRCCIFDNVNNWNKTTDRPRST